MTTFDQAQARPASALWGDVVPLAARLLMAAIFLISGVGKIAAPAGTIGYIASVGLPFPEVGYGLALIAEIGLGLALVAGFETRLAAVALAVFTLATAVFFHRALGDPNQMVHFLKNLAMIGGLLQIAAFGAGRISLDGRK